MSPRPALEFKGLGPELNAQLSRVWAIENDLSAIREQIHRSAARLRQSRPAQSGDCRVARGDW